MRLSMQVIEDDPKYWEVISSALAVGWLDIVVSDFRVLFTTYWYFTSQNNAGHDKFLLWNMYDCLGIFFVLAGEIAALAWVLSARSAWKS